MMISLNNHSGRAPNTNANFKKVATIQRFEDITEVQYQSVIEQQQLPPSGAQQFQYDLVEPATTIVETSLVRQKNAVRAISEPAKVVTESLIKKATHQLADSATVITEGLAEQKTAIRTLPESTAVNEQLVKNVKRVKTISETAIAITDGLIASRIYPRTIAGDTTTISEVSLVRIAKKIRALLEPHITINEELLHLRAATIADSPIAITESLAVSRIYTKALSENTAITESLRLKVIRQLSESIPITEGVGGARQIPRSLFEYVVVGVPYPGIVSFTTLSFTHSMTRLTEDQLARLVHHNLTDTVTITEALASFRKQARAITESDLIPITDSLTQARYFQRVINPASFTDTSFTTGFFESFNTPSADVIEITEDLEATVLAPWDKVLIEPYTVITESLQASKIVTRTISETPITIGESLTANIVIPTAAGGGGGGGRRRRPRWMGPIPTILQHRPFAPEEEEEIPEPMLTAIDIREVPIPIVESLSAIKITAALESPIAPIPKVASVLPEQPPQIIVYEPIPLLQASTLVPLEPEPDTGQPNALQLEKEPAEERLDPITISIAEPPKSKAAATLNTLQKLVVIAELEAMLS